VLPTFTAVPEHALRRRSNSFSVGSSLCGVPCHPVGKSASLRTIARARSSSDGFGVGLGETNWPTVDFVAFGVELPLQAVARTTSRAAIAAPFACLRPNTSRA